MATAMMAARWLNVENEAVLEVCFYVHVYY
jgi:hypothetical protein